jgi:membrane-bound metal-dependent hydrolase YbcI (DUF457 family)
MWPWEHVMFAYVLYSAYSRAWLLRPPSDRAALVIPVAALLPDLIDKPLAWQLSVLPAGRSLAHSLLFALPAIVLVLLVARRLGATDAGRAFAVAYLSHLPADSFYAAVTTGVRVDLRYLLWPLLPVDPVPTRSFVDRLVEIVLEFSAFVSGPEGWRFVAVQALLVSLTLGVWLYDGTPGIRPVRRALRGRSSS